MIIPDWRKNTSKPTRLRRAEQMRNWPMVTADGLEHVARRHVLRQQVARALRPRVKMRGEHSRDRNFFTPSRWPCTAGDLVGVGDRQLGAPLGQLPVGDVGDDRDDACLEGLLVVPPAAPLAATEMALVVAQLVHDLGHNGSCGGAAGRR